MKVLQRACRGASLIEGGQDVVRSLVRTGLPFPLQDRGPVMLKGLSEPIHLYEVAWGGEPGTDSQALMEGTLLLPLAGAGEIPAGWLASATSGVHAVVVLARARQVLRTKIFAIPFRTLVPRLVAWEAKATS